MKMTMFFLILLGNSSCHTVANKHPPEEVNVFSDTNLRNNQKDLKDTFLFYNYVRDYAPNSSNIPKIGNDTLESLKVLNEIKDKKLGLYLSFFILKQLNYHLEKYNMSHDMYGEDMRIDSLNDPIPYYFINYFKIFGEEFITTRSCERIIRKNKSYLKEDFFKLEYEKKLENEKRIMKLNGH